MNLQLSDIWVPGVLAKVRMVGVVGWHGAGGWPAIAEAVPRNSRGGSGQTRIMHVTTGLGYGLLYTK